MRKTWRGLLTNSIDHRLSFPTPTHMHIFGNHNSGTTILIQPHAEFSGLPKNRIVNDSDLVSNNGGITNFNLLLSFFDQVT
jgi:hypothetical protein